MKSNWLKLQGQFGLACLILLTAPKVFAQEQIPPAIFDKPEDAAKALVEAVKQGTSEPLLKIFGSDAADLVQSGDPVQDEAARKKFRARVLELIAVSKGGDSSATIVIGKDGHPFAVPLVKKDDKWSFDIDAGREEILNRRIGENEIRGIAVCRTYAKAQRDYAAADRDGDDVLEYAQKFISSEGKQDGLYWPTEAGEAMSPLGEAFADAAEEGYTISGTTSGPRPFHGYLFKILTSQGGNAPGGSYSYVTNGNMISGFAMVAYPAIYGTSGIMTFVVGPNGKVLQRDLGDETDRIAAGMKNFDPDDSWAVATKN